MRSGSTRSRGVARAEAVARLACDSRPDWRECSISESWISNSKAPGSGVAKSNDSHAVRSSRIRRALTASLYLRFLADHVQERLPLLVADDLSRTGQSEAAANVVHEAGNLVERIFLERLNIGLHQVCVVGVAKGPERKPGLEELIIESGARSLQLAPSHPALHLIQAIRDEAHRFAIVGHRARRGKKRTTSMLNEIPGIGAKRRQALIEHFGGLRGVQAAAIDDIAKVEGISRPLAERIYRHLHESASP